MNSIDVVKKIYKPYRLTKKGTTTIIESTSGSYVIKDKKSDIKKTYDYLKSRHIDYYPKLIDDTRSDINLFEYIEDTEMPREERLYDLARIIGSIHSKTYYYKEVSEDKFKSIYENIKNNILYLDNTYENLFPVFINETYPSPSHYLFLRYFTNIKNNLNITLEELDNWYDLVKQKKEHRVCLIHNNLSLEHYLKSDNDYLISWDNATFDTPVLDIYKLYKKEYRSADFTSFFKKYYEVFPLSSEEEKLLYILISIPSEIEFSTNEYNNTEIVRENLDYIYKTRELIKKLTTKDNS